MIDAPEGDNPVTALPPPTSAGNQESLDDFPLLPTETEIYILPDGRVVVADLPVELAAILSSLGVTEPCEVAG
jgi:hypothetical protein